MFPSLLRSLTSPETNIVADKIDAMFDDVLRREGGFVDHPADRGGPTKYGITQRTLGHYLGRAVDRAEVEALGRPLAA
jgi:lysozyme family protein